MPSLLQDLRFALRQIFHNPVYALVAMLSLAFGIGATTSVFSVVYAVLVNPYPYKNADRMVHIQLESKERNGNSLIQVNREEWHELLQAHSIEDAFAVKTDFSQSMATNDLPVSVHATYNTPNLFTFMGVPALLGREFTPSDAPNNVPQPVAVLSYLFWQRQFGGRSDILGKIIQINQKSFTVIGVVPRRFTWTDSDIYLPGVPSSDPAEHWLAFVRLKPGITYAGAEAELQAMVTRWSATDTTTYPKDVRVRVVSLNQEILGKFQGTLIMLFGAVALLLVIGCANLSILLLARGTARQHEFAVRASIGATRRRIVRQLLTESVLLSVAGAALGIALAYGGVTLITAWLPPDNFPKEAAIGVNLPVLFFTAIVSLVTGILFGIAPALQLSRPQLGQMMAESGTTRLDGSSGGGRTRAGLILGQVALTMLLLTCAGASIRAFLALYHTPLGYDPDHALSVNITLPTVEHPTWQQRANETEFVRQAVERTPGVVAASVSTTYLPPFPAFDAPIEILGSPAAQKRTASLELVSPQELQVLGLQLVSGRMFTDSETARAAHVALVNRAMVQQYFGGRNPIGQSVRSPALKLNIPRLISTENPDGYLEIVGVVGNSLNEGMDHPTIPAVILPYTFVLPPNLFLVVRTSTSTSTVYEAMRRQMRNVNSELMVHDVHDLSWFLWTQAWGRERFIASLFAGFALLALALAATGLYSVVSYTVAQRRREFGIRLALGAQRADVMQLAFRSTALMVLIGGAVGIAASLVLNRVMMQWESGSSRDPLMLTAAFLALLVVSIIACTLPALRAAAIDPARALRQE
ncbi:MAG TPA: ABC transporter permease [Silvibacterium sp.]|nr:ABC transporter permease [Silvibacterium sp.]